MIARKFSISPLHLFDLAARLAGRPRVECPISLPMASQGMGGHGGRQQRSHSKWVRRVDEEVSGSEEGVQEREARHSIYLP